MSDLEGIYLDAAVARAEGRDCRVESYATNPPKAVACWLVVDGKPDFSNPPYSPSTNWSQAGPIIEREQITIVASTGSNDGPLVWSATAGGAFSHYIDESLPFDAEGPTPLIAAMRAFVTAKDVK